MPKTKLSASSRLPSALVAGAAGLIGSNLCETLLAQNCQVYAVDNWSTGKKANLEQLFDKKNFVFLEQDLDKPFESNIPRVDYVFHLAGLEAYLSGKDVSLETLFVNSLGTKTLLDVAKKQSAKFLLASSADIFSGYLASHDLTHYFGADTKAEEVYSHHEAKRFSEAMTFEYVNRYHLDARIVRLGFVYGPKMNLNSGGEINQLFLSAKEGKPLKIFGQGLKILYPTYISDIVYGLTKAMFSQSSGGKIFTLINPEKITFLNLAYKLKQLLPEKNLTIEFVPGDSPDKSLSLSSPEIESQTELNWNPKINLDEGLLPTLKWLKTGTVPLPSKTIQADERLVEPNYTPEELGIKPAEAPTKVSLPIKQKKQISWPKFKFKFKFKFPHKEVKEIKLSLKPRMPQLSKRAKIIFAGIGILLVYALVPVILLFFSLLSASNVLKQIAGLKDISQVNQLTKLSQKAQQKLDVSRKYLQQSRFLATLVGAKKLSIEFDNLLFIGNKLSLGTFHLAKAGEAGTVLSRIIFYHEDGNITQALKEIKLNLDQAYTELSFVESELQSGREVESGWLTPLMLRLQGVTEKLPQIRFQVNQARVLLPLIPGFIAQDSKKTYLLLFQNSAELRPTGGFIGSYGLLTFEKGKLLDFNVEDIYAADGQLKGYIQPPKPIEKFLGQNTWYFRDSNWDPDFPVSAQRAEWFLGKTTNRNVDGVIAVNLSVAKELLKATGPIVLADYNEEITSENVFERAEYRSEIDFFPGSTQKRDFLGTLAREIFNRLKNSSGNDLLKLGQALETSLNQKELLMYLHDPESQQTLLEQNWAGAIFAPILSSKDNRPITGDYSYLVEANLGINKANYFLKRHIEHQLTILKSKEVLVVTTIDYQNQSPADTWPGGVYRSYLRDYLSKNATVVSVKTGDVKLNLKDVDQEIVNNNLVLGFSVTVPVKNSLKVEITYRLEQPLQLNNHLGQLAVIIPKQPGILDDQLDVIINYPSFLSVASVNPTGIISSQVVSFKTDMNKDRVFLVDFIER